MGLPPPPRRDRPGDVAAPAPSGVRAPAADPPRGAPPAELDDSTRELLSDAIAKAIAAQLGHVRISSVPPPSGEAEPAPPSSRLRTSMRAAAKVTSTGGKVAVFASGALSLAGSLIVWIMKPEYAAPLAQAAKLIAQVLLAAAGGGTPVGDGTP